MSLFKKTYTVSERDAEIAAARRTWSECDPLLVHLLGKSEQDYLDEVAANCPLATPEISEPRALTLTEKAAVDAEQNLATIFGGIYRDRECSSIPAIAALERAEEQNSFAKVFGRQPSVQTPFAEMLKAALQQAASELKKRYDRAPLAVPTSGARSEEHTSE